MKIIFLSEYYYPSYFGGSEVSAELFAKYLTKNKKCEIVVAAPNFENAPSFEIKDHYKIYRYSFPKHIVRHKPLSQFWHNSILLSFWRAFFIIKICLKEKPDIIHVQEKYLLIAGLFAKLILRKKLVITIRDYQLLCPMGFCIKKERGYKRCNFRDFFLEDFKFYINNYVPFIIPFQVLFLLRARFIAWIYRCALHYCDEIIFISKKQKQIYEINGIKKGQVIYNIAEFRGGAPLEKSIDVLFVGKPSLGKGIRILDKLKVRLVKDKIGLKMIGGKDFVVPQELYSYYRKAKLTIIPSFWEEPFGRVAIESLSALTPVLTTDKGGLPEIVEDKMTGLIAKASEEDVYTKLKYLLFHHVEFHQQIADNYDLLKEKFFTIPINEYYVLYKKVLS